MKPRHAELKSLIDHSDQLLKTRLFQDYEKAVNGLQVENNGRVSRIAAAVDATPATIQLAIQAGADLLVAHHGLFWSETQPWTGRRYALLRSLLDHNLAVYSSHLPLDAHPKLGNAIQLFAALGFRLKSCEPFFVHKGQPVGFKTFAPMPRDELDRRLANVLGTRPKLIAAGPSECLRIGIVTGGAGGDMKTAALEGIDTFITGEGPHWTFALAEELRLNVFYGGHYATETFGVKALAQHLSKKFNLPWTFIDYPTGL